MLQQRGHFRGVDADAEFLGLVRHVEHHHQVHVELLELQQQAHLAFDLRGVEYDQREVGHVVVQEVAHHLFVVGEAVQVVDAGQVDDLHHVVAEQDLAAEQLDRDAGPVADACRAAGHAVEQGGLAGVGHAQQCDALHVFCTLIFAASLRRSMMSVVPMRTCNGPEKLALRISSICLPLRKPSASRRRCSASSACIETMVAMSPALQMWPGLRAGHDQM